jgi:CDGSH-type Zn-finger protein
MKESKKIKIEKNGPYRVPGDIPLKKEFVEADEDKEPLKWRKGDNLITHGEYILCRCGKSRSKPFCDMTHIRINFNGTETASRESYENQAEMIYGPELDLMDASDLCARARFCHRCGGTWELTQKSDDPDAKKTAIQQACDCSSGRLTAIDKETGKIIEPEFNPSISLIEDLPAGVSGPLWVKGGIVVESSDGQTYESRNRQTLCRCGKSKNKPFCDGCHIDFGFDDKI